MKNLLPLMIWLSLGLATAFSQKLVNKSFTGVAIKGYDTVSYFTEGAPVKGVKAHQTKWNGATWRFANAENLKAFTANPEKYAPQYGGFCAWAMADGKQAPIDPKQWDITKGKLYLNYDQKIKAKWLGDKTDFIKRADAQWARKADKK